MKKVVFGSTCLLTLSLLVACGGGGGGSSAPSVIPLYTGSTSPASINAVNAQAIGETGGESVARAVATDGVPLGAQISIDSSLKDSEPVLAAVNRVMSLASGLESLPTAVVVDVSDEFCEEGGTAIYDGDATDNQPGRATVSFVQCSYYSFGEIFTIDGSMDVSFSSFNNDNSSIEYNFRNVRVSGGSLGTRNLNFSVTCASISDSSSCTTFTVFNGSDGKTHRISDLDFYVSSGGVYSGYATLAHNTHGSVDLDFNGIAYGSCGSIPEAGTLTFSSSNRSSGSITFAKTPCSVSGTWNDGTASGSF